MLKSCVAEDNVFENEPMNKHVSFKTGGRARFFVTPQNADELLRLVRILEENGEKPFVMGNGSNLLVSDKGFDGTIICIGRGMSEISVDGTVITAGAGALLSRIASFALERSLAGFEFASGIPGSLGGAVFMNAGAYGAEMKDVVICTEYIADGSLKEVRGAEHCFCYRSSVFKDGDVIVRSKIMLEHGDKAAIKAEITALSQKRREKQPLEYPSAGSTFKRPEGYFAAKLIDDAGLGGRRVGGAMVSEKHCGFVVNYDNATSNDIYGLMCIIKETVFEKFGVTLEPEVKLLGDFPAAL